MISISWLLDELVLTRSKLSSVLHFSVHRSQAASIDIATNKVNTIIISHQTVEKLSEKKKKKTVQKNIEIK